MSRQQVSVALDKASGVVAHVLGTVAHHERRVSPLPRTRGTEELVPASQGGGGLHYKAAVVGVEATRLMEECQQAHGLRLDAGDDAGIVGERHGGI